MVTFPTEFVATKFPGYFWDLAEKKLYSIKVSGVLRPIKRDIPCYWNDNFDGYKVSVNGRRRKLTMEYLNSLVSADSTIPVEK